MYRDIYNWLEKEKGIDSSKLYGIKTFAYKKKCTDLQAVLDSKACTEDELRRAVKDVYELDTFAGDLSQIIPVKSISISDMSEGRFVICTFPESNIIYMLMTNPVAKISLIEKAKKAKVGEIKSFLYLLDSDFEIWKKINTTTINNKQFNDTISSIETVSETNDDKYDANEDELNEESIVGIVNKIINEAVNAKASDIHIEPMDNEIQIRFRIDGILRIHSTIATKRIHQQIVNRIKVIAKMNTNNMQTPQSGKINMTIMETEVDMRVSTLPSIYGEKVTIRILISSNSKIMSLEQLGMSKNIAERVEFMSAHPHGIVLVSGPTGSGKSSTLASILTTISSTESNLITIEDPVEYKIAGAIQVDVSKNIGLNFANVLREVLRQDPDIIMIGEIRDIETAKIAITASNTGHLVFSTIHTNSAASTIQRLTDMGVENYALADSIIGIISQRLVKVLCPYCKKEHLIDLSDMKKYKLPASMLNKTVYEPCGCLKCTKGYTGRTIVPEILEVDETITEAINNKQPSKVIEEIAVEHGMVRQLDYAYSIALEGRTSLAEVYKTFGGVSNEKVDS